MKFPFKYIIFVLAAAIGFIDYSKGEEKPYWVQEQPDEIDYYSFAEIKRLANSQSADDIIDFFSRVDKVYLYQPERDGYGEVISILYKMIDDNRVDMEASDGYVIDSLSDVAAGTLARMVEYKDFWSDRIVVESRALKRLEDKYHNPNFKKDLKLYVRNNFDVLDGDLMLKEGVNADGEVAASDAIESDNVENRVSPKNIEEESANGDEGFTFLKWIALLGFSLIGVGSLFLVFFLQKSKLRK